MPSLRSLPFVADWNRDRTNLGNARTLNNDKPGHSLVETLDLQGDRYLLVVAIFFMQVMVGQIPHKAKQMPDSLYIVMIRTYR